MTEPQRPSRTRTQAGSQPVASRPDPATRSHRRGLLGLVLGSAAAATAVAANPAAAADDVIDGGAP